MSNGHLWKIEILPYFQIILCLSLFGTRFNFKLLLFFDSFDSRSGKPSFSHGKMFTLWALWPPPTLTYIKGSTPLLHFFFCPDPKLLPALQQLAILLLSLIFLAPKFAIKASFTGRRMPSDSPSSSPSLDPIFVNNQLWQPLYPFISSQSVHLQVRNPFVTSISGIYNR